MALQIGAAAPEFSLYDTNKTKISLSDFKGKNVVLLFFPLAFSGVCTKEMCEMQENYNEYKKLNAEIIGISVDSLFTNGKFKETYGLQFPLLSDFNKETIAAYDNVLPSFAFEYKGVSRRSVFVIDAEGIVRYIEQLASPGDYPNMVALKDAVSHL